MSRPIDPIALHGNRIAALCVPQNFLVDVTIRTPLLEQLSVAERQSLLDKLLLVLSS